MPKSTRATCGRAAGALLAAVAMSLLAALTPSFVAAQNATTTPGDGATDPTADAAPVDMPVSWSVSPGPVAGEPSRPNFVLEAAPGETVTDSLVVENHGDVTLVLGVVASDAFNTPTGGIDLLASDDEPVGVGAWVRTENASITVAPGESVTVPFEIRVPSDAAAGDHAGGIVTTLTISEPDEDGNRVRYERRLGTRIYLRVDGELEPALTFTAMRAKYSGTANPFAPGSMSVTYTVENTGNVRLRAAQRLRVDGGFGTSTEVDVADMAELLPGNSYSFEHEIPGVWPFFGTTTEVRLLPYSTADDPGASELAEVLARNEQSLTPTPQIVALIILAALVAVAVMLRIRSRARFRAAVDSAVEEAMSRRSA